MSTKPHALVVGASTTVGAEFARQLAARGYSLSLVARREARLEELAQEIRTASQVSVETLAIDLAEEGAVDRLVEQTRNQPVDFLVCNANLHRVGEFDSLDLETKLRMLQMNTELPVRLVHAYGPGMVARRRGSIVLLNTLNCMTALEFDAIFQGTKSFLLVFGESLWNDYRRYGVQVGIAMLSGIEGSESFDAKLSSAKRRLARGLGVSLPPERIVNQTLHQLDKGKCILVPDAALPINRAGLHMGLLVRATRSRLLARALSSIYRWFLDGDEVQEVRGRAAAPELGEGSQPGPRSPDTSAVVEARPPSTSS